MPVWLGGESATYFLKDLSAYSYPKQFAVGGPCTSIYVRDPCYIYAKMTFCITYYNIILITVVSVCCMNYYFIICFKSVAAFISCRIVKVFLGPTYQCSHNFSLNKNAWDQVRIIYTHTHMMYSPLPQGAGNLASQTKVRLLPVCMYNSI